jgi:hypothetical protein
MSNDFLRKSQVSQVFFVEPPVTDTFAEAVFFHSETRTLLVTDCALKLPSKPPKILESYGYDGTPGPISLEQWRHDKFQGLLPQPRSSGLRT